MIKRLNQSSLDKKYLSLRPYTATPIVADFSKLLVNKPWGNEYMLYSSPEVEVWNLFIGYQRSTSTHCHPNKKTSLLVIEGRVLFSSLNESLELATHDAVLIDPGTFHSTQALSAGGARVLEFESPPMKHDLVRLEDKYGRAQEGYETSEKMVQDERKHARLTYMDHGISKLICSNEMCIRTVIQRQDILNAMAGKKGIAVVLSGTICSKTGEPLYTSSDVVSVGELNSAEYSYNNLLMMFIGMPANY